MSNKSPVGESVESYLSRERKENALIKLQKALTEFNRLVRLTNQSHDISIELMTDGISVQAKVDGKLLQLSD